MRPGIVREFRGKTVAFVYDVVIAVIGDSDRAVFIRLHAFDQLLIRCGVAVRIGLVQIIVVLFKDQLIFRILYDLRVHAGAEIQKLRAFFPGGIRDVVLLPLDKIPMYVLALGNQRDPVRLRRAAVRNEIDGLGQRADFGDAPFVVARVDRPFRPQRFRDAERSKIRIAEQLRPGNGGFLWRFFLLFRRAARRSGKAHQKRQQQ